MSRYASRGFAALPVRALQCDGGPVHSVAVCLSRECYNADVAHVAHVLGRVFQALFRVVRPARHTEQITGWLDLLPLGGGAMAVIIQWLLRRPPVEMALVGVSLFALLSFLAVVTLTPARTLRLDPPRDYENEIVDQTPAVLWRIPVTNCAQGSIARNVEVTLYSCNVPELRMLPVVLHRMHDNPADSRSFRRQWDIRPKETLLFDLISQDKANPTIFYLFRSDGDPTQQLGPDWMLSSTEQQAIYRLALSTGARFTVRAMPDPPAKGTERDYILRAEKGGVSLRCEGEPKDS